MENKEAKCMFAGDKYIIVERAGHTVRIKNEEHEWCVDVKNIRPTNKEGRAICGKEIC